MSQLQFLRFSWTVINTKVSINHEASIEVLVNWKVIINSDSSASIHYVHIFKSTKLNILQSCYVLTSADVTYRPMLMLLTDQCWCYLQTGADATLMLMLQLVSAVAFIRTLWVAQCWQGTLTRGSCGSLWIGCGASITGSGASVSGSGASASGSGSGLSGGVRNSDGGGGGGTGSVGSRRASCCGSLRHTGLIGGGLSRTGLIGGAFRSSDGRGSGNVGSVRTSCTSWCSWCDGLSCGGLSGGGLSGGGLSCGGNSCGGTRCRSSRRGRLGCGDYNNNNNNAGEISDCGRILQAFKRLFQSYSTYGVLTLV